ncbi:SAF domain-containing protein, partial [Massilia agilis]
MKASRVLRHAVLAALVLAGPASAATVAAQVEQAARDVLARQLESAALSEPQVQVEVATTRAAAPCAQPLAIEPLDTRQLARMRFAVSCPVAGGWRYEYVVRAHVSAVVAVAASAVAPGEPLTDAAVALERRDVTLIPDANGAPETAVGQTSRRALRPGDV